jgi:prepilin-type N-terminal cleavage/methylation domain-containing protein
MFYNYKNKKDVEAISVFIKIKFCFALFCYVYLKKLKIIKRFFGNVQKSFQKKKYYFYDGNSGFTLIELIVSLGIFTFVIFISLNSFLGIIETQRKTISLRTAQDNLRLNLEVMAKEIRMGSSYYCSSSISDLGNGTNVQDCLSGGSVLTFMNNSGKTVVYLTDINGGLRKSDDGGLTYLNISSPDIIFKNLTFYVVGSELGDFKQPRITITAEVEIGKKEIVRTIFNLQTTISQRLLDS